MKPLPQIRNLGRTVEMFNQGCAAYRRAMQAWDNKDVAKYESGLLRAARDVPDALEWTLKIYLRRLANIAPEDRAKLKQPTFSQLIMLMEQYADPPLDRETINRLYDYREMRNVSTHQGAVPSPTEVENAITNIRQVMLTYLPLEAEQLSQTARRPLVPAASPTVFVSYSHKDEAEKERLLSHLAVIQQVGLIDLWSDDRIKAGADWRAEISQAIARAKVAILQVSANFLTSDFILNQEVPALLQRRGQEGLTIFPIITKACAWRTVPWLSAMQIRPKNGQPIWSGSENQIDAALAALAEEIAGLFQPAKSVPTPGVAPSPSTAPPPVPGPITGQTAAGIAIGDVGGDITGPIIARGDMVGGDKVIHYHYHDAEPEAEEEPLRPYEPTTVSIPAGPFLMGSDEGEAYEAPQHEVNLPAYRIGQYPVTNKRYAEFIRQTGRIVAPALLWDGQLPPEDKLDHPVTGVTWYEALAYCQWLAERTGRNYSLPSEAQWEEAARGTDGRLYPWGNGWQAGRCNQQGDRITAVRAYPAQNEYGCYDLVGNGREWTSTLWGSSRVAPNPAFGYPWVSHDGRDDLTAPGHIRRVYRGGPADEVSDLRCSRRGGFLPDKPGPRRSRHGFRVVLNVAV